MTNYFRDDNTNGYTAADLANLNARFYEWCAVRDISPMSGDKSALDHIAERILAEYDDYLSIGAQ